MKKFLILLIFLIGCGPNEYEKCVKQEEENDKRNGITETSPNYKSPESRCLPE